MAEWLYGASQHVALPSSPYHVPLKTADDLRRAYREYAKAKDPRVVLDGSMSELSEEGQGVALDKFLASDIHPMLTNHDQDTGGLDDYFDILKTRIDAFLATDKGKTVGKELYEAYEAFLWGTLNHTGNIPEDLYERAVATELCWRAQVRGQHKTRFPKLYCRAPLKINIITSFDEEFEHITGTRIVELPPTHSFEQFGKLMARQSLVKESKVNDSNANATWFYENPMSKDRHAKEHFKPITSENYGNFKRLLAEVPKRESRQVSMTLWHRAQIAGVRLGSSLRGVLPKVGAFGFEAWPVMDSVTLESTWQKQLKELGLTSEGSWRKLMPDL